VVTWALCKEEFYAVGYEARRRGRGKGGNIKCPTRRVPPFDETSNQVFLWPRTPKDEKRR